MPKKSIFDRYETYDTSNGFGNPNEWRSAFNNVLGKTTTIDEARSILGITKTTSPSEIKTIYRNLSKQFHPDKNPDTLEKFQQITVAYKTIMSNKCDVVIISKPKETPISTSIFPQLPNEIIESEVERYITDPRYCAQEKHDGRRRILRYENGKTGSINKKGLLVDSQSIFSEDCKTLANITNRTEFTLDGEEVNDIFHNFDILSKNGEILNNLYSDKIFLLKSCNSIKVVYTAYSTEEKRALFNYLKINNKEGIVFKLLSGTHKTGYSDEWIKFKFYATASVIITRHNQRNSVGISIYTPNGLESIGNVTMIGHERPAVGTVIEVKYLYIVPGGSLYQPSYLGIRDDVNQEDCTKNKLKFKTV